jgi:integrase
MFTILRETGMRASEVCQLQVRDVVLEPGRELLWVRAGKTGDRVVTLTSNTHARTLRGLRAYLKQIGSRPPASALFLSNRPMNNSRARTNAMEIFHNLDGAYEALESDTAISLPPIAALKP